MNFWGIAVGALIASAAWIYQRAWDHREKRVAQYAEVIDHLSAFTVGHLDPERMDKALGHLRRLWLFAPDDVVRAYELFLDAVEGEVPDPEDKLSACIAAMHRDATFSAVLFPRFWRTRLTGHQFRLRSTTAKALVAPQAPLPAALAAGRDTNG